MTAGMTLSRATPPPGTMPSSTAARVALSASSMRSLNSFISTSVAAPTAITATPPASLARRSCSFSLSYSLVVSSIWARMELMRALISLGSPAPSTMVVFSLSTFTWRAVPSWSTVVSFSSMPSSSLMTWPPVSTAISCSMALRLSPKPGALTATQVNVPRSLLTTKVARASPSTSSAIIKSFLPC